MIPRLVDAYDGQLGQGSVRHSPLGDAKDTPVYPHVFAQNEDVEGRELKAHSRRRGLGRVQKQVRTFWVGSPWITGENIQVVFERLLRRGRTHLTPILSKTLRLIWLS